MEDFSQEISLVLRNLLTGLPSFFTLLVCLVIALVRWKRHPKVSLIASLAFLFLILHGLVFSAAYLWLPRFVYGPEREASRTFFSLLALSSSVLFASSLAMLLMAVFVDRTRPDTAQ